MGSTFLMNGSEEWNLVNSSITEFKPSVGSMFCENMNRQMQTVVSRLRLGTTLFDT